MDRQHGGSFEEDTTPYKPATYAWLIVFTVVGIMFGPAIATFLGLGWPRRPGARGLLITGGIFIVLHILLMIAALSLPAFLPWLHEVFPGLGKTKY